MVKTGHKTEDLIRNSNHIIPIPNINPSFRERNIQHKKERFQIIPRVVVWTGKDLLQFIPQFS